MKKLLFTFFLLGTAAVTMAQSSDAKPAGPDKTKELMLVEAACGQCRLGLKGKGCDLAVRIKGKAYFVDGTSIDEHGDDAHADDGFCNAVRKAHVQGTIVKGRFKATYFQLADTAAKSTEAQ